MAEFQPVLIIPNRRIQYAFKNGAGGTTTRLVIPQVVVEEDGVDDLVITEHPVEQGAMINDHVYKRPAHLRIRMGWADGRDTSRFGPGVKPTPLNELYANLLDLQESALPFTVYTGKRVYPNMLFKSLAMVTTEKSEFALIVSAAFTQVIIVQTSTTQMPPREFQKFPERTAATEDRGTQAPRPGDLSRIFRGSTLPTGTAP